MFVSSYSTYIQSDISSKENKQRLDKPSSSSESFGDKLTQKAPSANFTSSPIPHEYLSKSQINSSKQELDFQREQLKNPQNNSAKEAKETINRFTANNSLMSAKNAYENVNKVYTAHSKQSASIDQTPKMDKNLPQEARQAKELTMRHKMVNTYISNENYYRITA